MSDIAVKIDGLSKVFTINNKKKTSFKESLRDLISGKDKTEKEAYWALKDVSFEIKKGDSVGIIGKNGAGKSTLLKILSRITAPTRGRIELNGRVSSLLEVGTGFHPELTGRENIYLNGTILGMTRREVVSKFDEIVAFSGVEKFLDTPVKKYSSGMYVRLAFSVAAHLEPEILIVDEVLAVGDIEFQKKCLGKMNQVANEGRTVIFVSHNISALKNICNSGVLLNQGELVKSSNLQDVLKSYLEIQEHLIEKVPLKDRLDRSGNGKVKITHFHIENKWNEKVDHMLTGEDFYFVFSYETAEILSPSKMDIGFSIHDSEASTLSVLYSSYQNKVFTITENKGTVKCLVKDFCFAPGEYLVGARVLVDNEESDYPQGGIAKISVLEGDFYNCGRKGFNGKSAFLIKGDWVLSENKYE